MSALGAGSACHLYWVEGQLRPGTDVINTKIYNFKDV